MFSSSTKICLFFLSIFILFQLNNGCVGTGGKCGKGLANSPKECTSNDQCCPGLKCQARGEFGSSHGCM
ncbi:hypothetical protein ACQ4LE_010519 [Meloidogyne hapla]